MGDDTDPVVVGSMFRYVVTISNNGPGKATGTGFRASLPSQVSFVGSFGSACNSEPGNKVKCVTQDLGSGASKTVQIVVRANVAGSVGASVVTITGTPDPVSGNNSASTSTLIVVTQKAFDTYRDVTYRSTLKTAGPGLATGRIIVNDAQLQQTDSVATYVLTQRLTGQELRFEAHPDGVVSGGTWRFDFSGSPGFEPGSLKVETGQVEHLDGTTVVFRLDGPAPVRFSAAFSASASQ